MNSVSMPILMVLWAGIRAQMLDKDVELITEKESLMPGPPMQLGPMKHDIVERSYFLNNEFYGQVSDRFG